MARPLAIPKLGAGAVRIAARAAPLGVRPAEAGPACADPARTGPACADPARTGPACADLTGAMPGGPSADGLDGLRRCAPGGPGTSGPLQPARWPATPDRFPEPCWLPVPGWLSPVIRAQADRSRRSREPAPAAAPAGRTSGRYWPASPCRRGPRHRMFSNLSRIWCLSHWTWLDRQTTTIPVSAAVRVRNVEKQVEY